MKSKWYVIMYHNLKVKNMKKVGTEVLKRGFAKMVKYGVIMDVTNVEQAQIAEDAGATAVMALERVPADIRAQGGVARMSDPQLILDIKDSVSIPVMAKVRIGHFVEAQVLEAIGVDMIDESEVLTPADDVHHIDKKVFTVPFVCGARELGEALRRIEEGAAMIRTKGEAGTGNVVEAVRHVRAVNEGIAKVVGYYEMGLDRELLQMARELKVSVDLLYEIAKLRRLPVVNFAAGGIATPADAAMMMQLGCDGVFVGSGIFKSENPEERARAIVEATYNYDKPDVIAEVSKNLGEAMPGIDIESLPEKDRLAKRGN
ncbi:pyridoxal 5'-phosphate synthase pdxS subunit [Methanofervidicoccus abyssi]|uniref:Pyridoxal 5'-phosphate synthase subunit PdxS n=2 Tax=Methanofervidicoccus abyssi TaxID=2082189 RepID=A0A401HQ06_9EURY|nr:pyridoxal 5'-phosphate synthase pdxS subunit [Methanofervidicoccus abyssi]